VNWIYRFHKAHPDIKARLSRSRDAQRAKNEDPRIIGPWFQRVHATKQKYGILDEDTYNFDETGFAMGLITGSGSSKVLTSSESVGRATSMQPGDRKWSTTIECGSASGYMLPPFVILEGKTHLEYYYQQNLPPDWTIAVSENGWTNDQLGFHFIQHFNKWTKDRTIGTHRLLILDGHGSHATPEFDLFCSENSIITECLPPHTSHILQPLDIACFSPLKTAYGHLVQNLARQHIFHIDKADFLTMYQQARTDVHSDKNIQSGFRATGLIPWNPEYVLSQLSCTPSPSISPPSTSHGQPPASSPWISETPRNIAELAKQTQLVQATIQHSSQSPTEPLGKVIKSCQQTMTRVVLLERRVKELEAAVEHQAKKKHYSRSQLQNGGVLQVQDALDLIIARDQATEEADRQYIQEGRKRAPPTCSNCHEIGHNRRGCKVAPTTS
jgi:hypothetical protein